MKMAIIINKIAWLCSKTYLYKLITHFLFEFTKSSKMLLPHYTIFIFATALSAKICETFIIKYLTAIIGVRVKLIPNHNRTLCVGAGLVVAQKTRVRPIIVGWISSFQRIHHLFSLVSPEIANQVRNDRYLLSRHNN